MNERELRDLIRKALRNARRQYRAMDTQGEKLERWLDRMIDRKTRIQRSEAAPLVPLWDTFKSRQLACEKAFADFLASTSL